MGMGTSVSTAVSERTAVIIEDYMFDAAVAGELTPEESPSDFHDTWDLDGTDFTPEASPDDEGYWDDFENVVLNGNYEELGSELVTNGDFATDSDWTKEAVWTIENGVANGNGANGSAEELTQPILFTLGKTYKVVYELLNYVSGSIRFQLAGGLTLSGTTRSSNNTFTEYVVATANHTTLKFKSTSFIGSIDNVSIKQVDPNNRWSLGTGWSISDGKAVAVATSSSGFSITQNNVLTAGVPHEITFTVSERTAGNVRFRADAVSGTTRSADGTYTEIITPAGHQFAIQGLDSFVGKIDNVSVKEYAITPLDV